jgi:hypothetical protein
MVRNWKSHKNFIVTLMIPKVITNVLNQIYLRICIKITIVSLLIHNLKNLNLKCLSIVFPVFLFLMQFVNASTNVSSYIFSLESKPYGLTLEEWATKWWQWAYSQPKGSNPLVDDIGGNLCKTGQDNEKVWYLAGSLVNNSGIKRSCNVPLEKAILFPVIVAECSISNSNWWNNLFVNSMDKLWKVCNAQIVNLNTKLDNHSVNPIYVKSSKMFELIFPHDNVKNAEAGKTQSVNKGYWLMIKPLPKGIHNITSFAVDSHNFRSNVTYYLTVK